MNLNRPELTDQALGILRNPSTFDWTFIPFLAFVTYVYFEEIRRRNWRAVQAGLALYAVHWAYEIGNALIRHFSGHALWTVPGGTSFLLLVGVGVELSCMFAVAGVIFSKLLPEDPKAKLLGLNNRVLIAVANAAFFSVFEIFLARTPAFHWVYGWWGAIPVFLTTYIPFFLAGNFAYDWPAAKARRLIGGLFALDGLALLVFAGILGWI